MTFSENDLNDLISFTRDKVIQDKSCETIPVSDIRKEWLLSLKTVFTDDEKDSLNKIHFEKINLNIDNDLYFFYEQMYSSHFSIYALNTIKKKIFSPEDPTDFSNRDNFSYRIIIDSLSNVDFENTDNILHFKKGKIVLVNYQHEDFPKYEKWKRKNYPKHRKFISSNMGGFCILVDMSELDLKPIKDLLKY